MLLYKYLKSKYLLPNLQDRLIKVTTLSDVNDPYEWLPSVVDTDGKHLSSTRCREIFLDTLAKKHGFISLSATASDPLLWAHYAEQHKGVALEFDLPRERLIEVDYRDSRVCIIVPDENFSSPPSDETMSQLMSRKFSSWIYEKEFRVKSDLTTAFLKNGIYYEPIPPQHFRRVILGFNCTLSNECIRCAFNSSGFNHVEIARACLSDTDFTMTIV